MLATALRSALAPVLLALVIFEFARLATGIVPGWEASQALFSMAARAGFIVLCLIGLVVCSIREWALLGAAIILGALLAAVPDGQRTLAAALDLGAFFGVFIAMLTVMKEAATRSRSVAQVGIFLTSQPPGRRFFSVAFGSHVMGAFLNFSAVSLISPLIQKGARASTVKAGADLERRQLSALLRGFSWILLWAPTTLTQAVLLKLFAGVDYVQLLALGIGSSILMILVGRVFDRIEWRNAAPVGVVRHLAFPRASFWVVSAVCSLLIATTYLVKSVTGFSVAEALVFVAPTITLGWLVGQGHVRGNTERTGRTFDRIASILQGSAPDLARSAIALGLSGFIGRVAANILPIDEIAQWMGPSNLSGWLFLSSLPILITLGGQIALSPIVFVVFLGEIITALPALPADPTLIVFALSVGWALSMTASPNATATLLISATCNIAPTTLTWRWNAHYALACYVIFSGIFFLLSR